MGSCACYAQASHGHRPNNSESLDAIRYFFQLQFQTLLERERAKKIKMVTEHILTSTGRVCGSIGIIGLSTSVRTVGCGLDACMLATQLLLRAVPLTRQGVRAAFYVVYLDTPHFFGWYSYYCGLYSGCSTACGLYSCCPAVSSPTDVCVCVCDPGLLLLWSRSAAVPPGVICSPAVPAVVSWRCGGGAVLLLLEPEKQKRFGELNIDGAPGRTKSTKKGIKVEGRWVVVSLSYHRVRPCMVVQQKHTYERQIGAPPKRFDIYFPLSEGCSEGLDVFRFFFLKVYTVHNSM